MKNNKVIILTSVLCLLIVNLAIAFSIDSSKVNLNEDKFKGKTLGIIIKLNDNPNYGKENESYLN